MILERKQYDFTNKSKRPYSRINCCSGEDKYYVIETEENSIGEIIIYFAGKDTGLVVPPYTPVYIEYPDPIVDLNIPPPGIEEGYGPNSSHWL